MLTKQSKLPIKYGIRLLINTSIYVSRGSYRKWKLRSLKHEGENESSVCHRWGVAWRIFPFWTVKRFLTSPVRADPQVWAAGRLSPSRCPRRVMCWCFARFAELGGDAAHQPLLHADQQHGLAARQQPLLHAAARQRRRHGQGLHLRGRHQPHVHAGEPRQRHHRWVPTS